MSQPTTQQRPKKQLAQPIYNPYKRKISENDSKNSDQIPLNHMKKKIISRSGMETPPTTDQKGNSSAMGVRSFLTKPVSSSSTFENVNGMEKNTSETKKVFNFQLDPNFRMNLMRKRMSSKINIKEMSEEPKASIINVQNSKKKETYITGSFLNLKKQSLDVVKLAEEKETANKSRSILGVDCDIKAHQAFDLLPNKQTLMGLFDTQKTGGVSRTQVSKESPAAGGKQEALDGKSFKGLFVPRNFVKGGMSSFDHRRGPIGAVHDVMRSSVANDTVIGEEDQSLIKKDLRTDSINDKRPSTVEVDRMSLNKGYFNQIFKKKSSSQLIERETFDGSVRRDRTSVDARRQRSESREVFEVKTQTYYMTSLKYNYPKKVVGLLAVQCKEHFIQTIGAFNYANLKKIDPYKYEDIEVIKGKIRTKKVPGRDFQGPRSMTNAEDLPSRMMLTLEMEKLTVVFDLDETLVSVRQTVQGANFVMPIRIKDGNIIKVDNM